MLAIAYFLDVIIRVQLARVQGLMTVFSVIPTQTWKAHSPVLANVREATTPYLMQRSASLATLHVLHVPGITTISAYLAISTHI
jgi:hypothetical protein